MHAQQIPGAHGAPPIPVGMPHPSLGPGALGGPLALGSTPPQHPLAILNKQELHRPEESKSSNSNIMPLDDRHVCRNILRVTMQKRIIFVLFLLLLFFLCFGLLIREAQFLLQIAINIAQEHQNLHMN